MTIKLAFLALALVAVPATAAERSFEIGGFSELRVSGPDDVTVVSGGAPGVVAVGEQRDLDRLVVEVRGDELRIGRKSGREGWFSGSRSVKIRVTGSVPRAANLTGSGNIVADRLKGDAVSASVVGSGNLSVAAVEARTLSLEGTGSGNLDAAGVQAQTVTLEVAGSGNISAAGRCTSADLSASGSGGIDARKLACQAVSASVSGSGDVRAFASREARVSASGSGNVNVEGNPASCNATTRGSGSARCR